MNTAWWLLLVAFTWSSIGLVVSIVLGRMFRDAAPLPDEAIDRLIC